MKRICFFLVAVLCATVLCFKFHTTTAAAAISYDMDKVLSYVWEGTEVYQESVLVVEEQDGTVAPIDLLYPINQIIEVKNASLTKTFVKGVDYSEENGKLVIFSKGSIPKLSYDEFHPKTGTTGFEDVNGGFVLWKEGSWYHSRQIVVTYEHKGSFKEYIPESKGLLLPNIQEKLKGEELNVLVYGDSISTGGNSSGHSQINVAPYMPIYPKLFCEGIKRTYGVTTVNLYNPSVGGTDSAWGLSNLRGGVFDKYEKIDLAILAFGMNDVTRDPESYASNMKRMANGLIRNYEGIEIIIVAPMLPNPNAKGFYGNQPRFYEYLMQYEAEGVVVADVTSFHRGVLNIKRYADLTGNNINHANDFLARLYAQVLLKTLEVGKYGEDILKGEDVPEDNSDNTSASSTPIQSDSVDSSTSIKDNNANNGCGNNITACCFTSFLTVAAFIIKRKRDS